MSPMLRVLPAPWERCALWQLDLSVSLPESAWACLDADERARAARLVYDIDRRRYLTAHVMLRELLSHATQLGSAARVRYVHNADGKPLLADVPDCHFSLSHSGDVGLVAIDLGAPVGVDVELRRPMSDIESLARSYFTAAEQRTLAAQPASNLLSAFFRIWTRKEACLKAMGTGLATDLLSLDTCAVDAEHDALVVVPAFGRHGLRLVSGSLEPDAFYAVASWRAPADRPDSRRGELS